MELGNAVDDAWREGNECGLMVGDNADEFGMAAGKIGCEAARTDL